MFSFQLEDHPSSWLTQQKHLGGNVDHFYYTQSSLHYWLYLWWWFWWFWLEILGTLPTHPADFHQQVSDDTQLIPWNIIKIVIFHHFVVIEICYFLRYILKKFKPINKLLTTTSFIFLALKVQNWIIWIILNHRYTE